MKKILGFLILLTACLAVSASSAIGAKTVPKVATGVGFQALVAELAAAYRETGGQIEEIYGGQIPQMVCQLGTTGGANLVISDNATLEDVSELLTFDRYYPLGDTVLVLAFRQGLELKSPQDLLKPEIDRVAHPDPQKAAYGRAAKAFLVSSGLLERVENHLVTFNSVPQVMASLIAGEIDAGFVNRMAIRTFGDQIGGYIEIPNGYPPIHLGLVTLNGGDSDPGLGGFLHFIASPKAREILRKYGVKP
ncbi:MAG: molybdate ABC transporter substrate-binding protein [Deltaproteobacteria bacterium]|jgi:molybdate transport system substrate-binding protein|nr:molybdate ABC transporter substrate-binding protein [Deltaproteobacteria bacterium]